MLGDVVTGEGLLTILVDTLEDLLGEKRPADCTLSHQGTHSITNLVTSAVSETMEKELGSRRIRRWSSQMN